MGIDRGLAKGFGFLTVAVVLIGSFSLALVGWLTGNDEVFELFAPVVAVYSAILALAAFGIAGFVFLRRRHGDSI